MTIDFKTNYDTKMLKKSRIVPNNTSKMNRANNIQLDKEDTQRSSLNSKYLSVPIMLKYPDSFTCFDSIDKLTCKVQLDLRLL